MTGNLKGSPNQYFLNDVINVEASVIQFYHVPLRVYVDSCVATVAPDVNAVPRYAFIEEYGCLIDAKLTGSQSHFLPPKMKQTGCDFVWRHSSFSRTTVAW
ncbi:hypothetical protein P4O66_007591 [Electrophorus voltai]|uniref:ZP domain-containing protein n=1 Tax=Electrophorus voltai TaxID=2609070 RepID=A0AAD8ZKY1_9TELE|nr:hypothetical protein P4O66_007591 [Electrophorus voltai]